MEETKINTKYLLLLLPIIGMLFFQACQTEPKEVNTNALLPTDLEIEAPVSGEKLLQKFPLVEGDLLFQDSDCGPFCDAIEKVTFGYKGAKLSHVGMVVLNDQKKLVVLEAITKGVVETPLDTFFNRSFDQAGDPKILVGRVKDEFKTLIPLAIADSKAKLGKAYDDVFDITNDKYYCSEMVYEAFKNANNNQPIFQLRSMTFKDPATKETFNIWADYFKDLNYPVPEKAPGLNPGSISRSMYLDIVYAYGNPRGYVAAVKD